TAYLNSPCFNLSGESSASFGFDYHMNGTAMGSLVLEASSDNGSTWSNVWSISGSQGTAWQSATVDLASYTGGSVQLRFLATSGSGWSSDIAVDNISVSTSGGGGGGGGTSTVVLTLVTDNYGSETSWELRNSSGTAIATGSGYGNNQTYTETFNLAAGCYDFVINDSYGDGICCSYGNGSYALTEGSTTLASGGSFGSSETKNFCVNSTTAAQFTTTAKLINDGLVAYPNPATNEVSLRASGFTSAKYVVMDVTGKQVAQGEMKNGEAHISLRGIQSGVYVIRAIEGDKVMTTKLVKQ
ncbi:MAG: T9SS type A sorting domain-containing protein, partial [Flammeovirgaceae bacterium]